MVQLCSKCTNANPPEAIYCFYDGALLAGHNGTPLRHSAGHAPFPSPFVFPCGQRCGNFNQLAIACQEKWESATEMLRAGYLASFFAGLGRSDLANAAREAARYPDLDRGMDQLLSKLPAEVLQPPRLRVEPAEVNLGIVPLGDDRELEIQLYNQGMRLLYGSVVSDSPWLLIGDGPGQLQKLFQFRDEATIRVHVRGQHLRAGNLPMVGRLTFDSNGGEATVQVRLQVPIKPFSIGVLAGSTTPRQLAAKAKDAPHQAAELFESGAVANWFSENGWQYPVRGPSASGVGAVQQFFEALGLARPPEVVIDKAAINFHGYTGQYLEEVLRVSTKERRPVYAHATTSASWLDIPEADLNGRIARIRVRVLSVPSGLGETLTAKVRVVANGNQNFEIPVTLHISPTPAYFSELRSEGSNIINRSAFQHVGGQAQPEEPVVGIPVDSSYAIAIPVEENGLQTEAARTATVADNDTKRESRILWTGAALGQRSTAKSTPVPSHEQGHPIKDLAPSKLTSVWSKAWLQITLLVVLLVLALGTLIRDFAAVEVVLRTGSPGSAKTATPPPLLD